MFSEAMHNSYNPSYRKLCIASNACLAKPCSISKNPSYNEGFLLIEGWRPINKRPLNTPRSSKLGSGILCGLLFAWLVAKQKNRRPALS